MKNEDLFIVGLINTLIITICILYYTDYQSKKEYQSKLEAMQTAIYLNDALIEKENIISSLKQANDFKNKELKDVIQQNSLIKELRLD